MTARSGWQLRHGQGRAAFHSCVDWKEYLPVEVRKSVAVRIDEGVGYEQLGWQGLLPHLFTVRV